MKNLVKIDNTEVASKILEVRGTKVIIDSDVAELYGVQTKHINQAVARNIERFNQDYLIELTEYEKTEVGRVS